MGGRGRGVKIVATAGPAVATPEGMAALLDAGVDVVRLNLAHGSRAAHRKLVKLARDAARARGQEVAILADLAGPKIRLGTFRRGSVAIDEGARFEITTEQRVGDASGCSTTYAALAHDVRPGDPILIDDGKVRLRVDDVARGTIRTTVVVGGRVGNHKGLNLPGVAVSAPAVGPDDVANLHDMLDAGVDLVALSFVRSPDDVDRVREAMRGHREIPVLAKIEKPEAVAALEEIVAAFDGLMVARGDLGVELALEEVPLVQKRAIDLCRAAARPVIVATQMLESMIEEPEPTRAEVSDVANAVLDGADAVMLSGETSVGRYPTHAVRMMARIVCAVERGAKPFARTTKAKEGPEEAIAHAAVEIAETIDAAAIVAFSRTGETTRIVAASRPAVPLVACSSAEDVARQLRLTWGARPLFVRRPESSDGLIGIIDTEVAAAEQLSPGTTVVVVGGTPPGTPGSTNTLRIHEIGPGRA